MKLGYSIISLRGAYLSLNDDMVPPERVGKIIIEVVNDSAINQEIAENFVKRLESELDLTNIQAWAFLSKIMDII